MCKLILISLCRVEYIELAIKYKPLNLGQGFPDYPCPEHVTKALADVATGPDSLLHQYTRGFVSLTYLKLLFNSASINCQYYICIGTPKVSKCLSYFI